MPYARPQLVLRLAHHRSQPMEERADGHSLPSSLSPAQRSAPSLGPGTSSGAGQPMTWTDSRELEQRGGDRERGGGRDPGYEGTVTLLQ